MKRNKKKTLSLDESKVEIGVTEDQIWSEEKLALIREYISIESAKQSPERKLRNEMLAIKYKMKR